MYSKVEILYGIDFDCYATGGYLNQKIAHIGQQRLIFTSEKQMLLELAELKEDYTVDNIEVFTTKIYKEVYSL